MPRSAPAPTNARKYMNNLEDARVFLRHAERCLSTALSSAPDATERAQMVQLHGDTGRLLRAAKDRHNRARMRYTANGVAKPKQPTTGDIAR